MASKSPTARTLEELRKRGYLAQVVEYRVPRINVLRDLYGFIDVLGIKQGEVVGIQACRRADMATRIKKIRGHENFQAVMASPIEVSCWGWGKMANQRWELREVIVE